MKQIPAPLQTHLSGGVTTLATCWQITRRDGLILRYTDHDTDIDVPDTGDGVAGKYRSAIGYTSSIISSNATMSVDNSEVTALLDDREITDSDLAAGLYDMAEVRLFVVNWADPSMGLIKIKRGWLGEITSTGATFNSELRGMHQAMNQTIGEEYSPSCRADLGDARCQINLASFTVSGNVTSVVSQRAFIDTSRAEAAGWFDAGLLTWTSGANAGREIEVKAFSAGGQFEMAGAMPNVIAVNDGYSVYAGCDKSHSTCIIKFNNNANFRGEPHVPGTDAMLQTPNAH